jgi:NDP-sugar pyrophosphorylase family protein
VQIGAILTLAGGDERRNDSSSGNGNGRWSSPLPDPSSPILGKNLVERVLERLRKTGSHEPSIIAGADKQLFFAPSNGSDGHADDGDGAIAQWMRQGVELLILTRADTYSDLDYSELVRFHLAKGAGVSRAYTSKGALATAVITLRALAGCDHYREKISMLARSGERYFYAGYVNGLASAQDFRQLVEDGLNGRCGLSPLADEVKPGVWIGEGADIDSTAVITPPAFIGHQARVRAYAAVCGASAIERHSEIDCGTTVEEAWVLEASYIGLALDVRRSIVNRETLFHLDRNVAIGIADRRLLGAAFPAYSAREYPSEAGSSGPARQYSRGKTHSMPSASLLATTLIPGFKSLHAVAGPKEKQNE